MVSDWSWEGASKGIYVAQGKHHVLYSLNKAGATDMG